MTTSYLQKENGRNVQRTNPCSHCSHLPSATGTAIPCEYLDLPGHPPAPEFRNFKMTEPPFRPREKLIEKQKYFQSIQKHTYLKGPFDKITSVAIPMALAASSLFLIGRGIYNMSHGIGKKE